MINDEIAFQNGEKEKRAEELIVANKELAFQNAEKEKRAEELIVANKELAFQNAEKEKRAEELIVANKELAFQNEEKEKRAEELIIAKANAEESDKLKTAFLQNMSHEIRTPLNGIIGFTSLLNEANLSKEEIKEYTAIIYQSGKRLIEIVDNVLDISKIQTGQVKIEESAIVINTVLADIYTFFAPIANARNISLHYNNLDDKFRTMYSDESKLHQILTNLVNNAIKYSINGSIEYGYDLSGDTIQFYVKDTGIGIAPEQYDKIFDRFSQVEISLSRKYDGAGLGLAICKGLVELLGGKIWVESELGKGTTFYFTLPYVSADVPYNDGIRSNVLPLAGARGKVLIAEDDWISSQYISTILSKWDINVIQADNGAHAVDAVRNTSDIDLILMDIRMPVMDGIEAAKIIKKLRPDIPIIAQTAYAFNEEKSEILSLGFDDYLSKPLEPKTLSKMIKRYLKKTQP